MEAAINPRGYAEHGTFVLLSLIFFGLASAGAHATEYSVDIRDADDVAPVATTIACSDDADQLCRAQVELKIAGKLETIGVIALFKTGNAYFRFRLGNAALLTDGRDYFGLSIGPNMTRSTATVSLSYTSQQTTEDNNGILVRPVIRYPPEIAKIEITVDKSTR